MTSNAVDDEKADTTGTDMKSTKKPTECVFLEQRLLLPYH